MPSHFSTIGFPIDDMDDFRALANRVAPLADPIAVTDGQYLRWSSDCGAEIWLQVDSSNDLIGMNPHFAGESRMRVGLTSHLSRPKDTILDGAFHGWADPPDDELETGAYPFVFDTPDFQLHSNLVLPTVTFVSVSAFAHEVTLYDSVEAYDDSSSDSPQFASQSFIPSGLFSAAGESTEPPEAHGILTGHIIKTERKQNHLSGEPFYWALVDSYGGQFDVVIDPELVEDAPRVGGVLSGSFWLSGRLL